MDDRKRQINETEQRKREQTVLLDALLANVGETILERTDGSPQDDVAAFGEIAVYRRFKDDIAGSQNSIRSAEEHMRRLRELEDDIDARERESELCSKDLAGVYGELGKSLLEETGENNAYADFCAPYRTEADELLTKVRSLEERLANLEQREKGNVFTWIGKSAQSLVLRSFLGKAQENLEQLCRTIGERFSRRGTESPLPENSGIDALCEAIERKRSELDAILKDLGSIKEEKQKISDTFSADGGPVKYIQTLKNHIAQVHNDLKELYRGIGAEATLIDDSVTEDATGRRQAIQSLLRQEDREKCDSAERMRQTISDCDTAVEKLKASLAIDDEKAKIEKCRRMVKEKQDKISQIENSILELENSIRDSEAAIEKLRHLM